MKRKFVILACILVIISAAAAVYHFSSGRDDRILLLSGTIEVTEVNTAFKIPGRVSVLYTDEGQSVKKGEKLADLDSTEYKSRAAEHEANLRNAAAVLEKAKKDLVRYVNLFKKGVVSAHQYDAVRTAYDVALAAYQQAAAARRVSEAQLTDTVIYSPISGIVLRKNLEAGETAAAGTPVFTIGDLEEPWVRVYVKEDKLGLVKLGQAVEVTTDSHPGKVYEGRITYISSEAEFTPKNVQTREERVKLVFGMKVRVNNPNDELKPGMPADVKIVLENGVTTGRTQDM